MAGKYTSQYTIQCETKASPLVPVEIVFMIDLKTCGRMRTLTVRNEEPSAFEPDLASEIGNSTTARTGGSSADDSASCNVMVIDLRR